jgi:hypothetical protein
MALTIDGSDPTGDLGDLLDAKLNLAGGKILQIVRATDSTQRSTTSGTYVDASISVTITPQKNNSAILLINVFQSSPSGTGYLATQITDNSDNAISGAEEGVTGDNVSGFRDITTMIAYATPATTSATTYKLRFRSATAGQSMVLENNTMTGQMYAIEVSA